MLDIRLPIASLQANQRRFVSLCYRLQLERCELVRLIRQAQTIRQHCHLPVQHFDIAPFPLYRFLRTEGVLRMVPQPSVGGGSGTTGGDFRCVSQRLNGSASVALSGELDLSNVDTFRAHLSMAIQGTGGVLLDLRDLRYLDSSGINALLYAHGALSPQSRRIALVGPSPNVRRILSVLALERLMPVFDNAEEALRYLHGDGADELPVAGA
jgi:anti-anti-sigma factor